MSIQIGINAKNSSTSITNNERIFLQSTVHSNMISMSSTLPESRILFDEGLTFGRSNDMFTFRSSDVPIVNIHPSQMDVYSISRLRSNVIMDGNVSMGKQLNVTQTVSTNRVEANGVIISGLSTSPCFTIVNQSRSPVFETRMTNTEHALTYMYGSFGINKNTSDYALDVLGDINASHRVLSACNLTRIIQNPINGTQINMDNTLGEVTITCSKLKVSGQILPIGGIQETSRIVDEMIVRYNTDTSSIACSNQVQIYPTIRVYHKLIPTSKNVIEMNAFTDVLQFPLMYMTPTGRVGFGTNVPLSQFDIIYNARQNTSNLLYVSGVYESCNVTIDKNANVGIGTSLPVHLIDVRRSDGSLIGSNAMIGLYTQTRGPFVTGYSNNIPVIQVSTEGRMTLGNIAYDSNWGLDVASSLRVPYIQTNVFVGDASNEKKIDFDNSWLSNVSMLEGRNMKLTELTSTSNLITNYFFSSNFEILGFKIFNTDQYFSIDMATMLFRGSNAVFSTNNDDLYQDPISNGKVRIHVTDALTSEGTSTGLNVIGRTNTVSQITAGKNAIMRIVNSNMISAVQTYGDVRMDEDRFFRITHSDLGTAPVSIQMNQNGTLLHNSLYVYKDGRVGINLNNPSPINPTIPEAPFTMYGKALFRKNATTPLMMIDPSGTGFVSINTENPSANFHVNGTSRFISSARFDDYVAIGNTEPGTPYHLRVQGAQYISSNLIVNGRIGIAKTSPQFNLDVNGNINFSGALYQNNQLYKSSQWTSSNVGSQSNIHIVNTNIGIGTTNPFTALDVRGTIVTDNVGIGTTSPVQSLHVQHNMFVNGNIGIGTTNPFGKLHVQTGKTILEGNVGIKTLNPLFSLHVNGDINFDGDLYQNGSSYRSSQWTTSNINDISYIYIQNSNIAIGINEPASEFHVNSVSLFSKEVNFTSNVSITGLLTTTGNIASVSDQTVKTNLQPITEALEKVSKINGYTYDRLDTGIHECGLIAQQVRSVLPEVVHHIPDRNLLTLSYGNMAGLFVEAIKELNARIVSLEYELHQLKSQRS